MTSVARIARDRRDAAGAAARRWLAVLLVAAVAATAGPQASRAGAASATAPSKSAKATTLPTPAAIRSAPERPPEAAQPLPPPRVYLFRGALGPLFSTGMDRLAEKVEKAGFQASVYEFTLCDLIALQVARNYRQDQGPIVLIGHSMGGLCSVRIAISLQEQNIPVALVVTVDPAHATKSVPPNVQRFINLFLSDNILGGGDVKPEPGFRGHYASFDMKDHDEVTHINIDKMEDVHAQLVTMISQLSQTSATAEVDPVQLRYLVPPKVSVELWDSGTPLAVRPGETLDQIAANYRVPLWALQQSNRGLAAQPLVPGQRIILPRHLLPQAVNQPVPPPAEAQMRR
ncbi:peptidoglycan-binding protein LysM [Bradyrhizobium sp. SSBR45G]|uniref:alpha/beta fold hydrolase n=1 Tax=unclassified Bradyrhizobium TaxID=2631580 RepID=UPI002342B287|nr:MULTISPECIES: alpha/beta fold hydrolase [unclassified Bradyrhizobium]GLH79502.1 peptidoglycan-binding protein LysM [Bradyrhizobium sp. SSBR45G]GLH86879.1 peptidoglycan-binding protein LysM [Bradyrhizobium sp. SSBR45R]